MPLDLDLTALADVAEDYMPDECVITRNPGGRSDDVTDLDTGEVTPSEGEDGQPVYDGPCVVGSALVDPRNRRSLVEEEAAPLVYRTKLPLSKLRGHPEREPLVGDAVRMTRCAYDPGLVGVSLFVAAVRRESYAVARVLEMRRT